MAKRVELLNTLPNDLRQLVIKAEAVIHVARRTALDQVESGEIEDAQLAALVELLGRAVYPEWVPVAERG